MDDVLMITSFVALLMAPFWAYWSSLAIARLKLGRAAHVVSVLALSIVAMLILHVGPWVLGSYMYGLLGRNLADPKAPVIAAVLFGPAIIVQIACALTVTRTV